LKNTGVIGNSRPVTLTGTGTFQTDANLTLSGVISGGGPLVKTGAASLILRGANNYSGTTTISAGTLQVGAGATVGTLGTGAVVNNATLAFNRTDTLTVANTISGSGGVTQAGTGATVLTATNAYTGATSVNAGTLRAGAAAGGQSFGVNSAVTFANVAGATLDLNGFNQTVGSLAGGGATGGNVLLGAATLTTGGDNTSTIYSGAISGSGGLTKVGTGTMSLTSTNSVGATTVSAGTLDIDGVLNTGTVAMGNGILNVDGTVQASGATQTVLANTAGTASTVRIGSGGTLLASGDLGDGNDTLDVAGTLNTGAGALNFGDGDDNFFIHDGTNVIGTVDGGIGTDTLTADIAGTVTLGDAATFEVLTKSNAGILNVDGTAIANFSTVNVNGGTLSHTGAAASTNGSFTLDTGTLANNGSGALTLSGTMAIANTATLGGSFSGAANSISGVISGAGNLAVDTAGTWILSGANTYSGGTTINAGTLQIGHNNFSGSIIGDVVNNGTLAFGRTNFMTFDGAISGSGNVH
jgi:autotransporter-associated beta strand protein